MSLTRSPMSSTGQSIRMLLIGVVATVMMATSVPSPLAVAATSPPEVDEYLVKASQRAAREAGLTPIQPVGFGWTLVTGPSDGPMAQPAERTREMSRVTGFQVEPNHVLGLQEEPLFSDQWALENVGQSGGSTDADIDILNAWGLTTGVPDVTIAVLDTGVDLDHPDLAPVIWENPGEIEGNGLDDDGNGYIDDHRGWDAVSNDGDPTDTHGHGTFVASISAAAVNEVGMAGVAPGTRVIPIRVCGSSGCPLSAVISGLSYAVTVGADVANLSLGGYFVSSALEEAVADTIEAGTAVVAAAGNDGSDNDEKPMYPASYGMAGVISVAATNHNDRLASWSNYGLETVDLGAPGASVIGAEIAGGWAKGSGTSFSSPHVAGVAALLRTLRPDVLPAGLEKLLVSSVDNVPDLEGRTVSGGRLNAAAVLERAVSPIAKAAASPQSGTLPFSVRFDGSASHDPTGKIVEWRWTLPDGETANGPKIDWTPAASGRQVAELTVVDDDGYQGRTKVVVDVNARPVAAGVVSPSIGEAPFLVDASARKSEDPDGTIVDWEWSVAGDRKGGGEEIQVQLSEIGVNHIDLEVTDDFGASATTRFDVLVGADFADTDSSVFHDAIIWLSAKGITAGCNPPRNHHFCPNDVVTRGQMAAFLGRTFGYSDNGWEGEFVDTTGHVFEAAADRLAAAGITLGCNPPSNDRFCPDDLVTRGQMAAFLARAFGLGDDGAGDLFVDDDGHVFEGAIDKMGTAGLTGGCNPPANDRFCPDDYVTRGQFAAFLKRGVDR